MTTLFITLFVAVVLLTSKGVLSCTRAMGIQ